MGQAGSCHMSLIRRAVPTPQPRPCHAGTGPQLCGHSPHQFPKGPKPPWPPNLTPGPPWVSESPGQSSPKALATQAGSWGPVLRSTVWGGTQLSWAWWTGQLGQDVQLPGKPQARSGLPGLPVTLCRSRAGSRGTGKPSATPGNSCGHGQGPVGLQRAPGGR